MTAEHWIKLELEESTGALTARQHASTQYGPEGKQRPVTVGRDVELPADMKAAIAHGLKSVIEANRRALEKELRKGRASAELAAEQRNEFDEDEEAAG
jgi:hypothetical protein